MQLKPLSTECHLRQSCCRYIEYLQPGQGLWRPFFAYFSHGGGQKIMSPQRFLHVASLSQCNHWPTFLSKPRAVPPCGRCRHAPAWTSREEVTPHFSRSMASIFGPISCSRSCAQNMTEMAVGPLTQLVKDWDESDVTAWCEFTLQHSRYTINTASKHSLESFVFLSLRDLCSVKV